MSKLKALWAYVLAEPTAAAACVQVIVPALVFFHAFGISDTQLGVIGAAISAVLLVVVGFLTHHPAYALMTGAVQALVALGAAFGYNMSPKDLALIIAAIGVVGHTANWFGTSSRVLTPARPALGKGPYKPEESPVAPLPAAVDVPVAPTSGNVKVKPATKRAKKPTPATD